MLRRSPRVSALVALLAVACSRPVQPHAHARTEDARANAASAPREEAPGTFRGRVIAEPMGFAGADWLERDDREASEQPTRVLDALHVAEGAVVADVGGGTGYFALRLARRVGPRGRVIATDIEPRMLERLRANAAAAGLTNIDVTRATEDDARLPENALDLVLMVDVYHELARPAETLHQVRRALRPGGRLALVEYRGEDPDVPIKPEHKLTVAQARREIEPEGFTLDVAIETLPTQHILVFRPL